MTAHLCMQLARLIINTTTFVHTGQKRARVQSARKTYEALGGAQVTHKFAVDPEKDVAIRIYHPSNFFLEVFP